MTTEAEKTARTALRCLFIEVPASVAEDVKAKVLAWVTELERQVIDLKVLVRRASSDSVVTTSDEPGCFYCDHAEEHADNCPVPEAIK